jgi:acyl-CoA reductase-like NAD-dependent aldehyde dehydrogenase
LSILCGFDCAKLRSLWARAKEKWRRRDHADLTRRERITEGEIKSGSVFINDSVPSRLPSGGVKESGCGRKLSSYGVKEFVNIKTVVVA